MNFQNNQVQMMENGINVILGNIPILLVACHAGSDKPSDILDRPLAETKNLPDVFTDKLIEEIVSSLNAFGLKPSAIIMGISRVKIDLNDPPELAYCSPGRGEDVYKKFHSIISSISETNQNKYGWSLLIDIHGFLARDSHLALQKDIILGTNNGSSMPIENGEKMTRRSFELLLSKKGWQLYPNGSKVEDIFPGGYIIRNHSDCRSKKFAIQLEISSKIRKISQKRQALANDLAEMIKIFSGK